MTTGEYLTVFGLIVTLLVAVVTGWINLRITVAKQSVKIEGLEKSNDTFTKLIDKNNENFSGVIGKIFEELKEIRDMLHEKANRQ